MFYINLPVGHRVAGDDASCTSSIPPYLRQEINKIDYWGIGLLAVWIGSLQIALDLGQEHDWFSSPFITSLVVMSAVGVVAFIVREWIAERADRGSARLQGAHVQHRRVPDDDARVRAVRQPRAAADHAADAARLSVAAGGHRDGAARHGVVDRHADGRHADRKDRCAQDGGGRAASSAAVTLIWLGQLNLNAGYWDIFWPQFFQGLGLSALFVPLTTISMDPIPRERMGNATSLFNLMRNLGGSVGIAVTGTMLARNTQAYINVYGANVDAYSPAAQRAFDAARGGFIARGSDPVTATQRAYAALFGMVQQQASMVAFVEVFRLLGMIFLLLLPLVLLMKRPRGGGADGRALTERSSPDGAPGTRSSISRVTEVGVAAAGIRQHEDPGAMMVGRWKPERDRWPPRRRRATSASAR